MYHRYKSDYSNQVHQLLVTVSKHFHVGTKGQLHYQFKEMDVKLDGLHASDRNHIIYYFLRDHFSGVYYAEVASSKDLIPINDFLLRAWLQKHHFRFCGVPDILMITKIAESRFPEIEELVSEFGMQKIYPPSGFASGMRAVIEWEKLVRFYTIAYSPMSLFSMWNPRVSDVICARETEENMLTWLKCTARVPDKDYIDHLKLHIASPGFKFCFEYPILKEIHELGEKL